VGTDGTQFLGQQGGFQVFSCLCGAQREIAGSGEDYSASGEYKKGGLAAIPEILSDLKARKVGGKKIVVRVERVIQTWCGAAKAEV
jgi:hypothetical protein